MLDPTDVKNPIDYGWIIDDNCLKPEWFFGISIPETATGIIITEGFENVLNNDVWSRA